MLFRSEGKDFYISHHVTEFHLWPAPLKPSKSRWMIGVLTSVTQGSPLIIRPRQSSLFSPHRSDINSKRARPSATCTNLHSAYLQPVRYLRQMRDSWLLVNEFPFVQISELGSVEPHSEVGSKHSLLALGGQEQSHTLTFIPSKQRSHT